MICDADSPIGVLALVATVCLAGGVITGVITGATMGRGVLSVRNIRLSARSYFSFLERCRLFEYSVIKPTGLPVGTMEGIEVLYAITNNLEIITL